MNYKTVMEKALEVGVSPRRLQYLCKKGAIGGAVKKAGVWLIPDGEKIPIQYSKSGTKGFRFTGTKKKIFDCAIELFKLAGFDGVGIKDITDAVGITQSSMYNHFKSKQELLDTMYDFYCYYFHKDLPTFDKIDHVLRTGTIVDIFKSTTFTYHADYVRQMSGIAAIIFYRCVIDGRAREIMQSLMIDEGIRVAKAVFDRGVEIGRLAPMNTRLAAIFLNSIKLYSFHVWRVDPSPETTARMREGEIGLYRHAVKLLTDLNPPHNTSQA